MNLKEIQNYPEEKRKKIFILILVIIAIIFMIIWTYDVKRRFEGINTQGEFQYNTEEFKEKIEKTKDKIHDASLEFKKEVEEKQAENIPATTSEDINTTTSINYAKEEKITEDN